jgi:hypothetical protein
MRSRRTRKNKATLLELKPFHVASSQNQVAGNSKLWIVVAPPKRLTSCSCGSQIILGFMILRHNGRSRAEGNIRGLRLSSRWPPIQGISILGRRDRRPLENDNPCFSCHLPYKRLINLCRARATQIRTTRIAFSSAVSGQAAAEDRRVRRECITNRDRALDRTQSVKPGLFSCVLF